MRAHLSGVAPEALGEWIHSPMVFFLTLSEIFCICRAHKCEFGSWGLGKVTGRAPEPLHGARGPSGAFLAFYTPLAREGLFAETPSRASLGRGASAYLQEELRSLCPEQESRQEFPWLFVRPSRNLFIRKEGCVCRAPLSTNLGRWDSAKLQVEPLASARSERAIRSSPSFLYVPRASFSLGRRGLFAEPPRVRA